MASEMFVDMSRLTALAEEVRRTNRPRKVDISRDVVAILKPAHRKAVHPTRRNPTAQDITAFEAAAGGWADVDADRFVQDVYENRRISTRLPVEL